MGSAQPQSAYSPIGRVACAAELGAPDKYPDKFNSYKQQNVIRLVKALGEEQLSVKMLMERIGLKDRENFLDYSLNPSLNEGFVRMLYPQSPRHPRQKYLLTVKGMALLDELTKEE